MICPSCRRHVQRKSNIAYVLLCKAIYAYESDGFICYDERLGRYDKAVEMLEHEGFIISTEIVNQEIAYWINRDSVLYIDPGYYCWCHLHNEVESNG